MRPHALVLGTRGSRRVCTGEGDEVDARPRESRIHDLWLELWAPMQLAILGWTMVQIHSRPPVGHEWLGLGLSMGLVTGAGGINVAHELNPVGNNPRDFAVSANRSNVSGAFG